MRKLNAAQRIGREIRRLREQRGYSLRRFAEISNVGSHAHLSSIERGMVAPTVRTLADIANTLEVPLRALIPGELDDRRQELHRRLDALPEGALDDLASFLTVLERAGGRAAPRGKDSVRPSTRRRRSSKKRKRS